MRFPFKLAGEKEFDAIGFGTNAVDFLIVVPEYPKFNSKVELKDYYQLAGGEVASTMVGLSRLGMKTAYIGRFGDDAAGDFGLKTLIDEGVNVDFAEKVKGARTQIAFIVIDERNGERTIIWKRDEKLSYKPEEAPLEAADKGKILHMTPHDTAACCVMAKKAKSSGTIVSLDIDNVFDGLEDLLELVDVFISSQEFQHKFLGIAEQKTALQEIKARYGCKIVGTTLGDRGSLILCEDKFIETKSFQVPGGCKDTTGAGDAFRAGFLYGILMNETVEVAAKFANAVAALKCRQIGARTALPDRSQLISFLSSYEIS
ncbi:MAG: carbohydrate kinase family protein [Acidobacteria bacterium]|jgi:sugar/nucleoside kinase (ribokinase family)|nr:MAG: carbohydrate kinase family protein [Acidobacteriota bacterium]GIU81900.1 MAG: ribokinase [Pyrinomonadaceae bacterium]